MVDLVLSGAQLLLALFLVVLNGFFVASEFAFVRVRATSVEQLAAEGRAGSETLQEVMANLDNYLAVTQLGITIASLGLGWVGEPAVASLIEPTLESVLPANLIHLVAFAIGFGIITFLHVVFGELAPKTIAIAEAEKLSLFVAPPMKFFYLVFYPGLVVFNGTANAFTSLLGVPPASETDEALDEREIRRVLARSSEAGGVEEAEVEMIERVFELDDLVVRSVMVPRPDVTALPADAPLSTVRATVVESGHTRYPVVAADDENEIVGFLDVKDVLQAGETGDGDATAGDLARDVLVVPETTTASDLLLQFRDEHVQMAAVVDEWGAFEGIATVEDVVEALVGDLRDEFDETAGEPSISTRDGHYDVDGSVPLADVNDLLDTDLDPDGIETVGGLVLDRLGRIPEPGDAVEAAGYTFEVLSVEGTRVGEVRVREREANGGDGDSSTGA